jgi:hypothetical protein
MFGFRADALLRIGEFSLSCVHPETALSGFPLSAFSLQRSAKKYQYKTI